MNFQSYTISAEKELRALRVETGKGYSYYDVQKIAYTHIKKDGYTIQESIIKNATFGSGAKIHTVSAVIATKDGVETVLKAHSYCGSLQWRSGMTLVEGKCTCKKCLK